jgi:hypothetical protein
MLHKNVFSRSINNKIQTAHAQSKIEKEFKRKTNESN